MDSHSGNLDVPNEAFTIPPPQLVKTLRTDLHTGLSSTEVLYRRKQFGANVGRQNTRPVAWKRFLAQFHDPQIYLLLAAALVTSIVKMLEHAAGLSYETYIILAIVLMNAVLSFLQEDRAERALAALADLMPRQATVLRDGAHQQMLAESLVPGDVILLNEGDMVPADARLTEVRAFLTNEAPLTGESLPVSKQIAPLPSQTPLADQSNMIFAGTTATAGTAAAVVTATGERTEFGKISRLLSITNDPDTPLQQQLKTLSKQLGVAVIFIAAATSIALLIAGGSPRPDTILSVLLFAIALAVAAAPEGLAAITTLVLAIGVQRMARHGAIVKTLSAVETLGSTTVIASDKTGTMTKNEITVRSLVTASAHVDLSGAGYSTFGSLTFQGTASPTDGQRQEIQDLLVAATLANNAHITPGSDSWRIQGDPTEAALLIAAHKSQLSSDELRTRYPRVTEIPFSSERK
ncbi:MAG TPA: HAD-IC family P-type ATPase, partial [Edaphobacter sp.]|nr:HAD-IC family P-type ATPase [Edaphobacter sp.]